MMLEELIAGDTLDFFDDVPEYPPADGWTLKYHLAARFTTPVQALITIIAITEGARYRTQAAAGITIGWAPGAYTWKRRVEKAGPINQSLGEGQIVIKTAPTLMTQGYDGRSQAAKAVDDLKAAMATFNATSGRIKSYSIGSRQMEFETSAEILQMLDYWQRQLTIEQDTAKIAAGMPNPRNVGIRFNRI